MPERLGRVLFQAENDIMNHFFIGKRIPFFALVATSQGKATLKSANKPCTDDGTKFKEKSRIQHIVIMKSHLTESEIRFSLTTIPV